MGKKVYVLNVFIGVYKKGLNREENKFFFLKLFYRRKKISFISI